MVRRCYQSIFYVIKHSVRRLFGVPTPRVLRHFCEDMGPIFVKFGQIIASSEGLFPPQYVTEFQQCLDNVAPMKTHKAIEILRTELGPDKFSKLSLTLKPIASASIAQVYSGILTIDDQEKDVVIKIQRPNLMKQAHQDLNIMHILARVTSALSKRVSMFNPVGMIDDLRNNLESELDFEKEAAHIHQFNTIMTKLSYSEIHAPKTYDHFCTKQVLVLERFYGTHINDIATLKNRALNLEHLLEQGIRSWIESTLYHGFFHADVHAGNMLILDNGHIGFVDFGIVGHLNDQEKNLVIDYMTNLTTQNYEGLAHTILAMINNNKDVDMPTFIHELREVCTPLLTTNMAEMSYGSFLPEISRVAMRYHLKMPQEFLLLSKQILYFDRYAKQLAPNLQLFTIVLDIVMTFREKQSLMSS